MNFGRINQLKISNPLLKNGKEIKKWMRKLKLRKLQYSVG